MKLKSLLFAAPLFAAALILGGCSSEQKQDASAAVGRTQPTMDQQRDSYVTQVENRVNDMTQKAQDLKGKAAQTTNKKTRKQQDNALKDLDKRLSDVRDQLSSLKSKDASEWVSKRDDVDKAVAKAEDAFNNANTYIK